MSKIVGALIYLYCSSGCKASVVASTLTFHPPEQYYDFQALESEDGDHVGTAPCLYKLILSPELPPVPREVARSFSCHMIPSRTGTMVPIVLFTHTDAHFTIVVSHGNASDIGAMFIFYAMLNLRLKVNVVGYDYTGYGASSKYGVRPTEDQTYVDIEAVYDWACEYGNGELIPTGVPENHIVLYGQSVGSGPSCYVASGKSRRPVNGTPKWEREGGRNTNVGLEAAPLVDAGGCCNGATEKRNVAGLVLHSPIMSGIRVLTTNRCLACFDIYPNLKFIKTASSPVFIIHGDADQEVTVSHGLGLQEKVPEAHKTPPWWVRDRGHNDILRDNEEEFFKRMMAYLVLVRTRQNKVKQREFRGDSQSSSSSEVAAQVVDADVGDRGNSSEKMHGKAAGIPLVTMPRSEKDYAAIAVSTAGA